MSQAILQAMQAALEAAEQFRGSTMPNPPVGATAINADGSLMVSAAHERAGEPHAEVRAIELFREKSGGVPPDTLVVTLEPCNHYGRTAPCTEAILAAGIRRVVYGVSDPNPRVSGGGAKRLQAAGLEVQDGLAAEKCARLIAGFQRREIMGRPYVTIKRAFDRRGSMIPPAGQKTFTSPEALRFAHELRRRSDAIVTGSGTVLADAPEFTIRHVPDPRKSPRFLVVLDRRRRVGSEWLAQAKANNFELIQAPDYPTALRELASLGAMEVLVEAGPTLSSAILQSELWDELIEIHQGSPAKIEIFRAPKGFGGKPDTELYI